MTERTLLFGIGAPKAGTSWLYDYLAGHPDCHLRSVKELHYFTAVEAGRRIERSKRLERRAERLLAAGRTRQGSDLGDFARVMANARDDHADYLAYLTAGADNARLVGDITPAYSTLTGRTLADMAALSPGSRFVYILRDPVARLWSHLRMNAERSIKTAAEFPVRVRELLQEFLDGGNAALSQKCDYATNVATLLDAVPSPNVMIVLFERLFEQSTLDRLCEFLNIAPRDGAFDRKVLTGRSLDMKPVQVAAAAQALAPQYAFARDYFGNDLPGSWQKNMERV